MSLETKALYNLLRMNYAQDPSIPCEKWQIEDLRVVPTETLFDRLTKSEIHLDKDSLGLYAKEVDSPEELADLLLGEQDPKLHDQIYLLLFELWRRLLVERQSLSIFFDELDHRIELYDVQTSQSDEMIQDALSNLADILEENLDAGGKPTKIFADVSNYCAHNLMDFIIDYIIGVLDSGNSVYASELIEDFAPFASEPVWFDFLRAYLTALSDPEEANRLITKMLSRDKDLDVELLLEILRFQVSFGERLVFISVIKKVLPLLQKEEEFHDLIELSAEYFHRRDREDLEKVMFQLLSERKKTSGAISSVDPAILAVKKLIDTLES